jgi:glycosyltransferase involved in cell wall biosynthesis
MKYKQAKVSIIIPVFNEEFYLHRCLETVVNQTLKDIEVIIVDDGSTDASQKICDEYANKYPDMIRVIHKKNEGQALARNAGLKISNGKYIGFVDADDWVELDMFMKMYEKAISSNADIVVCDVRKIFAETGKEIIEISMPLSSDNISIGEYIRVGLNPAYAWNKIYKHEIWERYQFKEMVYEDLEIILTIESFCNRIAYIQEPLITYFKRPNSTTTSYNNIRLLDIMTAYYNASHNANSLFKNETIFCVAKRILTNMSTPGLDVYKAEFIELIKSLSDLFLTNEYIINDSTVNKIYHYLSYNTIPKTIFYDNFKKIYIAKDNWQNFTRNFQFIELNETNCNISTAPILVRQAYKNKDFQVVGDYFKIKAVFQNGGISIDSNIVFKKPIGNLRAENIFFIFNDNYSILGGQKGDKILSKILYSYSIEDRPKKNDLKERVVGLLKKESLDSIILEKL